MSNANKPNVKSSKSSKPPERRYTQRRVLDAESELVLRQTYEKLQVLFLVVKNLQVEVQTLTASIAKRDALWLAILEDPEARKEASFELLKETQQRIEHFKKK